MIDSTDYASAVCQTYRVQLASCMALFIDCTAVAVTDAKQQNCLSERSARAELLCIHYSDRHSFLLQRYLFDQANGRRQNDK